MVKCVGMQPVDSREGELSCDGNHGVDAAVNFVVCELLSGDEEHGVGELPVETAEEELSRVGGHVADPESEKGFSFLFDC